MSEPREFTPQERERLCRATLEPQGLRLIRFWIDEHDLGHAECTDAKGRVFLFNQKVKEP